MSQDAMATAQDAGVSAEGAAGAGDGSAPVEAQAEYRNAFCDVSCCACMRSCVMCSCVVGVVSDTELY